MKRSIKYLVIALAVVLVVGGATAATIVLKDHREAEARQAAAEQQARQEAAEKEAQKEAAYQAAVDTHRSCTTNVGGLLTSLKEVDSRLNVGLTQAEMSGLVGDAQVAYDRVDWANLSDIGNCWTAGFGLETALNKYITTVNDWNGCIVDYGCDVDGAIDGEMQGKWSKASDLIDRAERHIDELDPASTNYVATSADPLF